MDRAYVWRAAIIAAVVNLLLNPGVAWVESRGLDFIPVTKILLYVAVATIPLCLLTSTAGAHRLHHEMRTGHRPFHGGTAEEKHLLAGFPAKPWAFGLSLGAFISAFACLVLAMLELLGLHGFTYGNFVTFMALYTGALAFLSMRWTIVRQLVDAAARVG